MWTQVLSFSKVKLEFLLERKMGTSFCVPEVVTDVEPRLIVVEVTCERGVKMKK